MSEEKKDDLVEVENLEISALDDKEMQSVSGGMTDFNTAASCVCCHSMATDTKPPV